MSVHLYGVVRENAQLPGMIRGRQGAPLRLVRVGPVAAIVSDVDAEDRVRRDDLLAHAHVLEAVVEDSTVLPMRFGTIVDSDAEVAENVLRAGESRLVSLLDRFDGLQQLTVRAVHDEDEVLRAVLMENASLRALRDSMSNGGDTHATKLELGRMVLDSIEAIRQIDAATLVDSLTPLAHDISIEDSSKGYQVLDAALLVNRADRPSVDAAIARISRDLPSRIRLRYVGPQPPYAFVDGAMAGESVWA
jgi:Gas vesicle synthesis protein GvpL/GvpF